MNDTKDVINSHNEVSQGKEDVLIHKDEYKIYNYFKEHPGFLVAFFSGLVATMSFIINFCMRQRDIAQLNLWSIDKIYAVSNYGNQLQYVLNAFAYLLVITITQIIIGKTAEAYKYRKNENMPKHKREKKIRVKGILSKNKRKKADNTIKKQNNSKCKKSKKNSVLKQILCSVMFSYCIGFIILFPFVNTLSEITKTPLEKFISSIIAVMVIVVTVTIINAILVVFSIKSQKGKCTDRVQAEITETNLGVEKHLFPLEQLMSDDNRVIISDSALLKLLMVILLSAIMMLLFYPLICNKEAADKKDFPIIVDDTGVYAVVYNNGEALVLEQATINDGTIVVDTTKQRIIKSNDISYEVSHFNNVYIRDNDNNG